MVSERKGLISAFAIGSYGLGSRVLNLSTRTCSKRWVWKTFVIWGAIVLVMIVFGATLMKDAPKQGSETSNGVVEKDYTPAESMRKPQYWMLAVMFLTACMSGLYVIGVAKDIAQSLAHLDAISAANAVTVISIANLSGRLVLGILSDKIARIRVITIGQVIALVGMAALLFAPLNAVTFFAAIACVAFNFAARLLCSRRWLVSSSASITRRKLRRHLPRFRYRQHLWFDYRFTVWRILCDFLRDFRPADSVTGAFYDHSPARAENVA